jgi:hypothetical protein
MKTYATVAALALLAGMTSPSIAFDASLRTQSFVTPVTCDVHNDDKQALCAQKCDDAFISGKMHYNADLNKVKAEKKACDEKCGCAENSKDL